MGASTKQAWSVYLVTVFLCWLVGEGLDFEESLGFALLTSLPLQIWYLFGVQSGKQFETDQ